MVWLGIIVLLIGIIAAILPKTTYHLKISSASGEIDALDSMSEKYVSRIVTAFNEALIKRG
jgi:hypothetical protein